jgi:hypothetical protein
MNGRQMRKTAKYCFKQTLYFIDILSFAHIPAFLMFLTIPLFMRDAKHHHRKEKKAICDEKMWFWPITLKMKEAVSSFRMRRPPNLAF